MGCKQTEQIKQIVRSPKKMMDYHMTGRLPVVSQYVAESPLIRFFESIPPRDRLAEIGITISPKVGYVGSCQFANVAQALLWLKPQGHCRPPSDFMKIQSFKCALSSNDVAGCCHNVELALLSFKLIR